MLSVNSENLQSLIESSKEKPLILDFYADWCGPCMITLPRYEQASNEMDGKAIFGKINVEDPEGKNVAIKNGVSSIPTFIVFKNGVEVERFSGAQTKDSLIQTMNKHI